MPRWLSRVLNDIHALEARRQVRFTIKALTELAALDLGLDVLDACEILAGLSEATSVGRQRSRATGECMYVFKPEVAGVVV